MNQTPLRESKDQIIVAFNKLLSDYKKQESKVATKEEEAEKLKNKELLTGVADYKIANIVNSMASLQLDFGNIVNQLAEKLTTESTKLEQLKKAILVEKERLEELLKIRVVADVLYIIRQEHQEKLKNIQTKAAAEKETLNKVIEQTRKIWTKQQQEFELECLETQQKLVKKRQAEEAEFLYNTQKSRQREMAEYQEKKRLQERLLQEQNLEKEKNWSEREKYLADNLADFETNQKKIQGFEEELKKAYNDAKGEAIKDADREAKIKSDLFEKEWEAAKQGYELQLESLQAVIERQTAQMAELNAQLQTVTTQAQNLALRAFQSNSN